MYLHREGGLPPPTEPVMTADQIAGIKKAIADCDRYVAIESPRSADLRPADVAELLAWYITQRAKLQDMLAAA